MEINDLREFDHRAIVQERDTSLFSARRFFIFSQSNSVQSSPIQSNPLQFSPIFWAVLLAMQAFFIFWGWIYLDSLGFTCIWRNRRGRLGLKSVQSAKSVVQLQKGTTDGTDFTDEAKPPDCPVAHGPLASPKRDSA
jgi:hypothetical protein